MFKKITIIIVAIIAFCTFYYLKKEDTKISDYFKKEELVKHYNGAKFSGSAKCINCHKDIYNQHIQTAHFLTSTNSSEASIKAFSEDLVANYKVDEHHTYTLEKTSNGIYQVLKNDSTNTVVKQNKIDIVLGSGVKGQSFLSWNKDELYQLQLSYFVPSKQWINSPGFKNEIHSQNRPIFSSCLECHATFIKNIKSDKKLRNTYSKKSLILGVDCERCHGPANKHVEYHNTFPNDTLGKHIVKHSQLSRNQKIDLCALCHSGAKDKIQGKEFHYIIGDSLDKFLINDFRTYYKSKFRANLDVHGNQVELLKSSECFKKTETMDCNTCHDPHKKERGNSTIFNQKCMSCHSKEISCGLSMEALGKANNNCIACHMPRLNSKSMKVQSGDSTIHVKVRTHHIKIYKEDSKQLQGYINEL